MSKSRGSIKAGSARQDLRPYLTSHAKMIDGAIKATFDPQQGLYEVVTANRFGETRVHRNLTKPQATEMVAALRARSYPATYRKMTLA